MVILEVVGGDLDDEVHVEVADSEGAHYRLAVVQDRFQGEEVGLASLERLRQVKGGKGVFGFC